MANEMNDKQMYDFSKILTEKQLKEDPEYNGTSLVINEIEKFNKAVQKIQDEFDEYMEKFINKKE